MMMESQVDMKWNLCFYGGGYGDCRFCSMFPNPVEIVISAGCKEYGDKQL